MNAHVSRLAGIGLFVAVSSASALAQDALGTAPNGFRAPPNPLGTVNGLGTPNALSTAPNALGPAPNRLGSPSLGTLPLPESWRKIGVAKKLRDGKKVWGLYGALKDLGGDMPEAIELLTGAARPIPITGVHQGPGLVLADQAKQRQCKSKQRR